MSYNIELQKQVTDLSKGYKKLDIWVTETEGFDDPGVFLLHRRRSLFNGDAVPYFETFANPCTLVEYPYRMVDRNWGLYRDRELSLIFRSDNELNDFWDKIVGRQQKLVGYMNAMERDINNTGTLTIDDVVIKQSSSSRPYTRIDFEAASSVPFLFKHAKEGTFFVGINGVEDDTGLFKENKLSIITYTPRASLFMSNILSDLAERPI
jgi:hypothetical protein